MKKIDTNELKMLQMEILDYFDEFCKRNHIKYWIDYGTLLGAIRHKGYIPWDDDVDIAMLREDYNKAAELFNKQTNGKFIFQTPFNDKNSRYPFGKLINTQTILYEYGEEGIKTGVYIDVFVYDNSPEEKKAVQRVYKKRDILGRIRRLQLPMREGVTGAKKVLYKFGSIILRPLPKYVINKALDTNARKYEKTNTKNVSTFVDPYDPTYFAVEKGIFTDLIDIDFEGKKYPAPRQYDKWLKVLYGDYMELPPVEKRVCQHAFEAFFRE